MSSSPPPSRTAENELDLDADMEDATHENEAVAANDRSSTLDNDPSNTANAADPTQPSNPHSNSQLNPHLQSRKDVSLREFLSKMDEYAPIIPDAVTAHYLTLAGLPPPSAQDPSGVSSNTTPLPLARLLALATQKFVADIAADAYQYSRIRASHTASAAAALGGGLPGQAGGAAGGGVGGASGAGNKGAQNSTLGVQRAGFGGGGQGGSTQGKTVLTMEDLGMAVQEYGINVRRGEFYR